MYHYTRAPPPGSVLEIVYYLESASFFIKACKETSKYRKEL